MASIRRGSFVAVMADLRSSACPRSSDGQARIFGVLCDHNLIYKAELTIARVVTDMQASA